MASTRYKDEVFKKLLLELKPYAKLLPKDSDIRHRVTLWLKKLLSSTDEKDQRNAYCQVLLQMLKEGHVNGVFREIPPVGPLNDLNTSSKVTNARSPKKSNLLEPGWARSSPLVRKNMSLSTNDDLEEENIFNPKTHSPRSLSLEDLLPASHTLSTSGAVADHSPLQQRKTKQVRRSKNISFNLESSDEEEVESHDYDIDYALKPSPPSMPWLGDDDGSDSDVTDLLVQNHSRFRPHDQDMDFLQMLQSHHASLHSSPARQLTRQAMEHTRLQKPPPPTASSTPFRLSQSQPASWKFSSNSTNPVKLSSGSPDGHREIHSPNKRAQGSEARISRAETTFYEERSKMQQKLEQTIRELLDRKNNELEDIKSANQAQSHKMESQIESLERQVTHLQRESAHFQGELQRQENDSKLVLQQQKFTLQSEAQQQLSNSRDVFEQERSSLQQKHSHQVQKLLDDCAARMASVEDNYKSQLATSTAVIEELECRVGEAERQESANAGSFGRLAQEKVALEGTLESIRHEIRTKDDRLHQLVEDFDRVEAGGKQAQHRYEEDVAKLKKQSRQLESQWAKQVKDLDKKLSQSRSSSEELEKQYKKEFTELEILSRKRLQDERKKHNAKVHSLENGVQKVEHECAQRVKRLEHSLKESNSRFEDLRSLQRAKIQEAQKTLDEYRRQAESKSNEMATQLQQKIETLEREVSNSHKQQLDLREEFTRQLEERQRLHATEVDRLAARHQQDLDKVSEGHQRQLDRLHSQHERDTETSEKGFKQQLQEKEVEWKDQIKGFLRENESLESQVLSVSEEVHEVRTLSRKELADVTVKWEEERLDLMQQHEAMVSKLRAQSEEQLSSARRAHCQEVEEVKGRAASRLKHMEGQYSSRVAQINECMEKYKGQISVLEDKIERLTETHARELRASESQHREEMQSLRAHSQALHKATQHESDTAQKALGKLEDKLQEVNLQHSEKMSNLKLSNEARLRALLPQAVQKDYEKTISSLREQVKVANKRVNLLQQELAGRTLSPPKQAHSPPFVSTVTPSRQNSSTFRLALFAWCLLTSLLVHPAASFPTGAPQAACRTLTPRHFSIPQIDPGSIKLFVRELVNGSLQDVSQYTPSKTYQVTLMTQRLDHVFCKGFLIQARRVPTGQLLDHIGAGFTEPAPGSPANYQLSACDPASSGVTHTDSDEKSNVELEWVAPPASAGTIEFRYTCVQHYNYYYVNLQGPTLRPDPSASTDDPVQPHTTQPPSTTSAGFRSTLFSWISMATIVFLVAIFL